MGKPKKKKSKHNFEQSSKCTHLGKAQIGKRPKNRAKIAEYAKRISKLKSLIWLGWIPRIIGLVFGILWFLFGVLESLYTPSQWYIGLMEGLLVGGGILVTTWILFKRELTGAIIFGIEAIFVFSLLMFNRVSHIITYLGLGVPLFLIAILAFIHYFVVKNLLEKK